MPLHLPQLSFAIKCDENELEFFDVKQEDSSSISAFVASEAGKNFRITYTNNLLDFDLSIRLHIDGELVGRTWSEPGKDVHKLGIHKNTSVFPFKFQELELTDPDNANMEDASIMPEMGTIEVRAFRVHITRKKYSSNDVKYRLYGGRVSERSKMAGWHHVSTADEVPLGKPVRSLVGYRLDALDSPCATFKIFYRPRELLMAQGIIPQHYVAVRTRKGSKINDNSKKRTREDELLGPSKRHTAPTVKKEEISVDARAQQIQDPQGELNSLMAEHYNLESSVKHEIRSPSPIVVGKAAGEVVDLTLEDRLN